MNGQFSRRLALALALALAGLRPPTACLGQGPVPWHTGADFNIRLNASVGIAWQASPLRESLAELSRSQRITIFLDRRVDPGQPIHFAAREFTLRNALQSLAGRLGLGLSCVGSVVYLGPEQAAAKLATLAEMKDEEGGRASAGGRRAPFRSLPCRWSDLATPREIVQRMAADEGLTVSGLEQIPHDLWPAADWPELTLGQRLTLVLAGFDLSFEFPERGQTLRLIPMPQLVSLQRAYFQRPGPSDLARIKIMFPHARFRQSGQQIIVEGLLEDHRRLERILQNRPSAAAPQKPGKKVYTLEVKNSPAESIVKTIVAGANLKLQVDPNAAPRLTQLVSFQVRDAPLEDLLAKTLHPLGLAFRLENDTLAISLAEQR